MSNHKIYFVGPYSLRNLTAAPEIYLFSFLFALFGALRLAPFWIDVTDQVKVLASTQNPIRVLASFIKIVAASMQWWVICLLFLVAITLPIRGATIGPITLTVSVLCFAYNYNNIMQAFDVSDDLGWVLASFNVIIVLLWIKFRWWYWALKGGD